MKAKRNYKLVRTIQRGIRELGMKEYEYRAIYSRVTGKSSISGKDGGHGMTDRELWLVIEALKKEGFNPSGKGGTKAGDASRCELPQARKVRSLWLELKSLGELRDSSEKALLTFVSKRIGVDRMEWAGEKQLQYIIEVLKRWVDRVKLERRSGSAAEESASTPAEAGAA